MRNYRQHWRNPSTHDYQLFFSEQESYLAIVNVSSFVSILLDQMLEKIAYNAKIATLKNEAQLARDRIKDFVSLDPIDKVWRVLMSFASHYLKNFEVMSLHTRITANAQLAAFITTVAPELTVEQEVRIKRDHQEFVLDIVVSDKTTRVAVETRGPRSYDSSEAHFVSEGAIEQLSARLRLSGLKDGVIFFYPGMATEIPIATTASSAWPRDLNLREVFGADPSEFPREDEDESTPLVDE